MIKRLKLIILSIITSASLAVAVASPPVYAAGFNPFPACGKAGSDSKVCAARNTDNLAGLVQNIISLMLWLLGAVSVIMIVIGGFKFVTSNGDSSNIQSAKNTILYAVIGLAVAILGQAIVLFVVNWLK